MGKGGMELEELVGGEYIHSYTLYRILKDLTNWGKLKVKSKMKSKWKLSKQKIFQSQ